MTNREHIETLETRDFVSKIVGQFWKIAEKNKMDGISYNQQNCYNDLIKWLDEEYDEQKEIEKRKAKHKEFAKHTKQLREENGIPIQQCSFKLDDDMIKILKGE